MTRFVIKPSSIRGKLAVPSSKSHTLRAILFSLMANGKSRVYNYLPSPDTNAMIHAVTLFGAGVKKEKKYLEIEGVRGDLKAAEDVISCGNSGQVLRFVGALASLCKGYTILTGDHSIRHRRPVKPLLDALHKMGVLAVSSRLDGFAPIIIKGPLKAGMTTIQGQDSQPVSGLLIACAFAKGESKVHVMNAGEKPWVNLTLKWFDRLKIRYEHENFEKYAMHGGDFYDAFEYTVPSDFSSVAFPIGAALIAGEEVTLVNMDMDDPQGDKKIIETLQKMGADIKIDHKKKTLHVKKAKELKGSKIDVNEFIDSIPMLSVIGCFASGPVHIYGGKIARSKECDRIHAACVELTKMGAKIEEKEDGLIIHPSKLKGAELTSYADHRMAISLSVAAMAAEGESTIDGVECIQKTYPSFSEDFKSLGASLEVVH